MKDFPFKRPILFAYRAVAISALLSTFFFFFGFGGSLAGIGVAKIDVIRGNLALYHCPYKDCLGNVEYVSAITCYALQSIMKRIVCAGLGWRIGSNQAHCSRALRIQLIELNRGRGYGV